MDLCRRLLTASVFLCFTCCAIPKEKPSIASQVEAYLKGIEFMAADFNQVINSREIYSGKFWLSKKGKTKVKVKYTSGLNQDVLIIGDKVVVVDNEKSKKYRYSISQTPLYSILSGSLDLSRENSEVIENSDVLLRLKINKSSMFGGMSITLVFSKYKESGNIKNLEAWIVDDGKTETLFSFDIDSLSVNDEKKVPQEVFN